MNFDVGAISLPSLNAPKALGFLTTLNQRRSLAASVIRRAPDKPNGWLPLAES
jgi:hypothetical protein